MAKRRARSYIKVELSQTFCPRSKFADSAGQLMRERVEVTYTENDPVRGWSPVSFEYAHRRELVFGNQFDDLAEGLVKILGGDLADFKASHLLSGYPECGCGHMHFVVHRAWRLGWSRKRMAVCLALHGKSNTEVEWKRRKEALAPIWGEMRKHQAECARQDQEAAARAAQAPVSTAT